MKGIHALIIAVGLGIAGALFNFMYLSGKAKQQEMDTFIGIKGGKTINRGEALRDGDLVPVNIPRSLVGNLKDFAYLYSDKGAVVDRKVCRNMTGERLLLKDDMKTPLKELELEEGESVMWIPVDTRAFVPSLVKPGDEVSFIINRAGLPTPAIPGRPGGGPDEARPVETIGPFTILALGNRLSSADVMRSGKMQQMQENVLAIRVSDHVAGERQRAESLWSMLQATNFRNVGVKLHNRKE